MSEPETATSGPIGLPLIRLSLVKPIVQEVERRGVAVHDLLDELSLSRDAVFSSELFVPAQVMYTLLEALARAAEDPYLAVAIGENLDLTKWPVFIEAVSGASSVGDFFNRFTIAARAHATSIKYELTTDGAQALFKARRGFTPNMVPAQADAFYAGLIVNIFQHAIGIDWEPKHVTVTVCDLHAVPSHYHGMYLQQGDKSGATIRFPMAWLLLSFSQKFSAQGTQDSFLSPPRALINAIRESLKPYLHLPDLSVTKAAEICGFKERVLRSKLHDLDTSLSREMALLREERATQLLRETNTSIAEIGDAVGFSDPGSFTRSFKKWTGMSPKEYRQRYRTG
ncbi:MAG: helix-turn-helix domain-containing protein [Chromatiaceae bacterium]|jgi:AraC-like DNA-binding protein